MDYLEPEFYGSFYEDLRSISGGSAEFLIRHWEEYGKKERRIPNVEAYLSLLSRFDWEAYVSRHPHITNRERALLEWLDGDRAKCVHLDIVPPSSEDFETCLAKYKSQRDPLAKYGVNVLGNDGDFGLAQNTTSICLALEEIGIPFSRGSEYDINIITYNLSCLPEDISPLLKGKYNIAVWAWELEETCPVRIGLAKYFDEIWAISSFTADEVRRSSPNSTIIPMKIPPPPCSPLPGARATYGIKEDTFVCLSIFDFRSSYHRKNPLAVLDAFRRASPLEDSLLIFKINGSTDYPKESQEFRAEIEKDPREVLVIDKSMTREEIYGLIDACDVYISLHRAEGSGLAMMEAMSMGKPVIATNYSGNLDFMNDDNSLLVDWEYADLDGWYATLDLRCKWAEPDIGVAASYLKILYRSPDLRRLYGDRAKESVLRRWTHENLGKELRSYLPVT